MFWDIVSTVWKKSYCCSINVTIKYHKVFHRKEMNDVKKEICFYLFRFHVENIILRILSRNLFLLLIMGTKWTNKLVRKDTNLTIKYKFQSLEKHSFHRMHAAYAYLPASFIQSFIHLNCVQSSGTSLVLANGKLIMWIDQLASTCKILNVVPGIIS